MPFLREVGDAPSDHDEESYERQIGVTFGHGLPAFLFLRSASQKNVISVTDGLQAADVE
jgi:hypothetical protein